MDPEDPCPTETEEETVAQRKKRARRVSFVDREVTSVHIFNRDDDFDTPPSGPSAPGPVDDAEKAVLGFFRDLADSDDSNQDEEDGVELDDEEAVSSGKSFLRPLESPSPGSSIIGSATFDDEENFFGPVSANFIRPGRLSDSAVSDDHDVTMDSTAFSMHYRSLMRSESGDLKTPTTVSPAVQDDATTPSSPRSLMVLTNGKKKIPQYPIHVGKVSGGRDSNDMSLVGDNPLRFDYAKLSPALEALLARGDQGLPSFSIHNSVDENSVKNDLSTFNDNANGSMDKVDNTDRGRTIVTIENSSPGNFDAHIKSDTFSSDLIQLPRQPNEVQLSPHPGQGKNSNQQSQLHIEGDGESVVAPKALDVELQACASDTLACIGTKEKLEALICPELQQHPSEDCSKENCPVELTKGIGIVTDSDKLHQLHLEGSISTFFPKQKQILLHASNSYSELSYATPSGKQPGPSLIKAIGGRVEACMSSQGSNPKLNPFQPSPLASSLKAGIGRSKERISKLRSSGASVLDTVAERKSKGEKSVSMDAPIINLGKNLFSNDQSNTNEANISYKDDLGTFPTPNFEILDSNIEKQEASGFDASGNTSQESACRLMKDGLRLSPYKENTGLLPSEARQQPLIPMEPVAQKFVIPRSDTAGVEIISNHIGDMRVAALAERDSNSVERSVLKLLSLEELEGSGSRQEGNHNSTIGITGYNSTLGDKVEASFSERGKSQSRDANLNDPENTMQRQKVHDTKSSPASTARVSDTWSGFGTPLSESIVGSSLLDVAGRNVPFASHPAQPWQKLVEKVDPRLLNIEDHVDRSELSPKERPSMKVPVKRTIWKEPSQSPPDELHGASECGFIQSDEGKHLISGSSSYCENGINDRHLNIWNAQSLLPQQNLERISGEKRKVDKQFIGNLEHANKISRIEETPNHPASDSKLKLGCSHGDGGIKDVVGNGPAIRKWKDILLQLSTYCEVFCSPSSDELDRSSISLLEYTMNDLQKVKMHQLLCSQLLSQRAHDESARLWQKRVAEAKSLLYKLVYEKAKLQLLSLKRDKLLKRSQQLSSAIRESQVLKANLIQSVCSRVGRSLVEDGTQRSSKVSFCGEAVSSEKVITLRHELEVNEKTIRSLIEAVQSYGKINRDLSCSDMIIFLNDQLKQKSTCQLLCEDLQLWQLDHFGHSGEHNIVLNYQGFLKQRFKIIPTHSPGVYVSIELNGREILKSFPNMDATVAFSFVLKSFTEKDCGSKSLTHETQFVSSHLRNLLDVIEEVQLVQIKCRNLVQASFSSPTDEHLDLELSFIDFKSGTKMALAFDMTRLKCGFYPSEVIPYKIQATIPTLQLLSETFVAEVRAALDSIEAGYARILRLCKCVSDVMESSSEEAKRSEFTSLQIHQRRRQYLVARIDQIEKLAHLSEKERAINSKTVRHQRHWS